MEHPARQFCQYIHTQACLVYVVGVRFEVTTVQKSLPETCSTIFFMGGAVLHSQQESSANNNFQFYQQLAIIIQQYNVQILNSRREREPREHRKGYQSSYRQSDKRMTLAPPKLLMQLRFVCCLASKSQIKMIDFNCICFQTLFGLRPHIQKEAIKLS